MVADLVCEFTKSKSTGHANGIILFYYVDLYKHCYLLVSSIVGNITAIALGFVANSTMI